ncbi:MAG: tRNA (adenosine(37)-N6)-dimethylallyltransferase MiaA [Lachnospiraceae bacterium]|nr:tRNA (adenosine(37)-N6)-dimethylallyltransferase MiaA [Lachnospiraceae bacterium]
MSEVVFDDKNIKKPLVLLGGPTGAGKSDIALALAERIDGEIISADSVAVYRGLDIGSAKPDSDMLSSVKHHLIDVLDPDEYFGVDVFADMAKKAVVEIYQKGRVPIIVGGTHFYIQALLYDIDFEDEPEHDDEYRDKLYEIAKDSDGPDKLHNMLLECDPEYASSVHMNNVKRVIRALEYVHYTGRKFSEYNEEQKKRTSPYDFAYFALNLDRQKLYERIDKRVDLMVEAGLVDEVKSLVDAGYGADLSSMSSIGYKEICAYLNGEYDLTRAIELIKQNSRHFAKRQLTWLRKEEDVIYIDRDKYGTDEAVAHICDVLADKGII